MLRDWERNAAQLDEESALRSWFFVRIFVWFLCVWFCVSGLFIRNVCSDFCPDFCSVFIVVILCLA